MLQFCYWDNISPLFPFLRGRLLVENTVWFLVLKFPFRALGAQLLWIWFARGVAHTSIDMGTHVLFATIFATILSHLTHGVDYPIGHPMER